MSVRGRATGRRLALAAVAVTGLAACETVVPDTGPVADTAAPAARSAPGEPISLFRLSDPIGELRQAAERGVPEAQLRLARRYDRGEGVPQSYAEAVIWYRMAAAGGNATAKAALSARPDMFARAPEPAVVLRRPGEPARDGGAPWPQPVPPPELAAASAASAAPVEAADAASAAFEAGVSAYKAGAYAQAFAAWRPLADDGLAEAQYELGKLYENGEGVARNHAAAADWYGRAAEGGLAAAQFSLGLLYIGGKGVAPDLKEAHVWFDLAASQGDAYAAESRDTVAIGLTPAELAEARSRAAKLRAGFGRSVATGRPTATPPAISGAAGF